MKCTYKQIFCVEKYCLLIMPPQLRSALSKFRCVVAPIRIETGRYENLKENERVCPFCNCIEDEVHVQLLLLPALHQCHQKRTF